ncbi:MAG: hypothetical protein U0793_24910 [Gemmataceae bacterium]
MSILGPICFRRAYYYCHRCGGLTPWDQEVGLTAASRQRRRNSTTLAGNALQQLRRGRGALPKLAALRLSESTVQRTSEAAGQRLDQLLLEKKVLGGPDAVDGTSDLAGRTRLREHRRDGSVRQQAFGGARPRDGCRM